MCPALGDWMDSNTFRIFSADDRFTVPVGRVRWIASGGALLRLLEEDETKHETKVEMKVEIKGKSGGASKVKERE